MQGHRMPRGFGYKVALWFTTGTFQAVSIPQEKGRDPCQVDAKDQSILPTDIFLLMLKDVTSLFILRSSV